MSIGKYAIQVHGGRVRRRKQRDTARPGDGCIECWIPVDARRAPVGARAGGVTGSRPLARCLERRDQCIQVRANDVGIREL